MIATKESRLGMAEKDLSHLETYQQPFEQALLACDRTQARAIVQQMEAELPPEHHIVDVLFLPVLEHIGTAWEASKVALSQVYMSGRICEELLESVFTEKPPTPRNTPPIAIAVLYDYHVLGKRIVCSMLRASGYQFLDYGHGIEAEALIQRVQTDGVEILLLSTLMLPAAYRVQEVSTRLKAQSTPPKIIVGGAPFRFDDQLWQQVGADAMGKTATDALHLIDHFVA